MNICVIKGNMCKDVELRYTTSGTAIGSSSVAVNRKWTGENGEKKEEVSFLDVVFYGKQAELAAQYLKKGNPALLSGRLKQDRWDDKQTGQKRSRVQIVVQEMTFLHRAPEGGHGGEGSDNDGGPSSAKGPTRNLRQEVAAAATDAGYAGPADDSDAVPF